MNSRTDAAPDGPMADVDRRYLLGVAGLAGMAAAIGIAGRRAEAGPLSPPVGPVVGTGKTLTELSDAIGLRKDAVPITSATAPGNSGANFRIANSGSFYFPNPLHYIGASNNGCVLEIAASDVDVDLNGAVLQSNFGFTPSIIRVGVAGQGAVRNVTIRNGTLRAEQAGVGTRGISIVGTGSHVICLESLRVIDGYIVANTSDISCVGVRNCAFEGDVGGNPIALASVRGCYVADCEFLRSGGGVWVGDGSTVERCRTVSDVGAPMFSAGARVGSESVVRDCVFTDGASWTVVAGSRCVVERCVVSLTPGFGPIGVRAEAGCVIQDNLIDGRGAAGATGVHLEGSGNRVWRNAMSALPVGVYSAVGGQIVIQNTFAGVGSGLVGGASGSLLGTFINPANFATQANPYANLYV